jgi:hypothetical protein
VNAQQLQEALINDIASFHDDPYGFVLYSFEWGVGDLEEYDGPDEWQTEILKGMRDKLRAGRQSREGVIQEALQIAVASGHGIGKSALVAWIILWAISTLEDTKGVVTAKQRHSLKLKHGRS